MQDFPDGGANPEEMRQPIVWQNFCQKLHENERIWSERGRVSLVPPSVADSRGDASPLRPKIFSISCSFSENLAKSYVGVPLECWRPLLQGILDPPRSLDPPLHDSNVKHEVRKVAWYSDAAPIIRYQDNSVFFFLKFYFYYIMSKKDWTKYFRAG